MVLSTFGVNVEDSDLRIRMGVGVWNFGNVVIHTKPFKYVENKGYMPKKIAYPIKTEWKINWKYWVFAIFNPFGAIHKVRTQTFQDF